MFLESSETDRGIFDKKIMESKKLIQRPTSTSREPHEKPEGTIKMFWCLGAESPNPLPPPPTKKVGFKDTFLAGRGGYEGPEPL